MHEERSAIHAYLTHDAHETWHQVAEEEGISLSGLLEVLAADMRDHPPADGGHPRWNELVKATRRLDAARRRRGGGRSS